MLTTVGEWPEQLALDGNRGSVAPPAVRELARFLAKVVADPRPGGCHHWTGAIGDDGYGRFKAGTGPTRRTVRPHRWIFEQTYGLRPLGHPLLHVCDETGCVAVDHLLVGTQAQNMAHMHARGRGSRHATSTADLRGPAGRARAIRAALQHGWDHAAFTAAVAAGDPHRRQLALPLDLPRLESPATPSTSTPRRAPRLPPPPVPTWPPGTLERAG